MQNLYATWGFWSVLVGAVTPIPYKVFTIASGVFNFDFRQFVVASIVGRSIRFFMVSGLIYWGGERLKREIDRYFDLLAWVLLSVVILSFTALKLV